MKKTIRTEILEIIRDKPGSTSVSIFEEIRQHRKVSIYTVQAALSALHGNGLVSRVGDVNGGVPLEYRAITSASFGMSEMMSLFNRQIASVRRSL